MTYKDIAEKLWDLLDEVDTLSDIIKPNGENGYKCFYNNAMRICSKRHDLLSSDGYGLKIINQSLKIN